MNQPDFISAALWCLAGYDLDLHAFAEMRDYLPEQKHARACIYIERALRLVIEAKCEDMITVVPGYQNTIDTSLGDTTETLRRAHEMHPYLITDVLTSYAIMLGALSSYGTGVWTRYDHLVNELWEDRQRDSGKSHLHPVAGM